MKKVFILAAMAAVMTYGAVSAQDGSAPLTIEEIMNPQIREALATYSPNYDYIARDQQVYAYNYALSNMVAVPPAAPVYVQNTDVITSDPYATTSYIYDDSPSEYPYGYSLDYPVVDYDDWGGRRHGWSGWNQRGHTFHSAPTHNGGHFNGHIGGGHLGGGRGGRGVGGHGGGHGGGRR